jgi:transposase
VVVAPKPAQPIDKGLPGPGLLAFVITSKYYDHLPLNRQEAIIARLGVDIHRSTLCGWMAASADLLRPLYKAMLADVLMSRVVQTDETRLPVLEKGNLKTKSGRLWAFVGDRDHPHTVYHYTATKARDGPAGILKNYKGFLQADAANVFDGIYHPGDIVEVGCWAHARRYFHEARTSDAARGAEALARIGFFYDVEREAKTTIEQQQLDGAQADAWRLKMRQERTLPKLREFADWLDAQAILVLPKSPIAQAINYARNHWQALLRFTEHGFLNIDNNASERAMRPAALGRKNYLFAGSDEGGRTTAVLYTFTQTCRRHSIDPFAYLQDVLTRLPKGDFQELADLFPHRWAEAQRAKADPSI